MCELNWTEPPIGIISRLVEQCTWYHRGHGFESFTFVTGFQVSWVHDFRCFVRISNFMIFLSFTCISSTFYFSRWPAPSWFDSSVGGALHQCHRSRGFESLLGLFFFFQFYFHSCLGRLHKIAVIFHGSATFTYLSARRKEKVINRHMQP